MYYVLVRTLAQDVVHFISRHALLKPGDRVGAAVSGGADSVALLRLLLELRAELGIVLSAVHLNHKLRGQNSDEDERFVARLARHHELEFFCESGEVSQHAAAHQLGLEAAARELRYEHFSHLLRDGSVNRIATAHILDDQAETVLMRLARGSGTRGLAGIYPRRTVAGTQTASIIRPLLAVRGAQLREYLKASGQAWREDESNRDLRHVRNRVRHGILPRLERSLNPKVREALAETAEIAREEEAYWSVEVAAVLPLVWEGFTANAEGELHIPKLEQLPVALRRRVVMAAADLLGIRLEFHHAEGILDVGAGSRQTTNLPGGWVVSRHQLKLRFCHLDRTGEACSFDYSLPVPGRVEVPEVAALFEASLAPREAGGYNRQALWSGGFAGQELRIRNWRAGDRFWPAHSKTAKKVKELLQERHITGAERRLWPVVAQGNELIWMRGFAARAAFRPEAGETVAIREIPLMMSRAQGGASSHEFNHQGGTVAYSDSRGADSKAGEGNGPPDL